MDNVVADALSRIETNALLSGQPPNVDFADMAKTQATDSQIQSLQSSPSSTLVVEAVSLANSSHPLYCDTSTGTQRPLVPLSWRRTVFDSLHGLSPTQESVQHRNSSLPGSYGLVSTLMFDAGLATV